MLYQCSVMIDAIRPEVRHYVYLISENVLFSIPSFKKATQWFQTLVGVHAKHSFSCIRWESDQQEYQQKRQQD